MILAMLCIYLCMETMLVTQTTKISHPTYFSNNSLKLPRKKSAEVSVTLSSCTSRMIHCVIEHTVRHNRKIFKISSGHISLPEIGLLTSASLQSCHNRICLLSCLFLKRPKKDINHYFLFPSSKFPRIFIGSSRSGNVSHNHWRYAK